MPVYAYKGLNAEGKKVSGNLDAENIKTARQKLRRLNIFPTDVTEGNKSGSLGGRKISTAFQRVKTRDLASLTKQLSTLIAANIPLVDALSALVEQIEHPLLKEALADVREKVTGGTRLADAMRAHPKVFNDLYTNMVAAGETSGALDVVLARLADFTESQARLKSKVMGAMTYPILMTVMGSSLMFFLLVYIVPKIAKIFTDAKVALPLITRVVLGISGFLSHYWYVVFGLLFGFFYGFRRFKRTVRGRFFIDRYSLRIPIFGSLIRMIAVSRFCRTLSTMLASGVQLLTSMDIVKGIVQNTLLIQAIEETKMSVKEGESIAQPLKRSGQFPPIVTQMIAIGEKTGELESMLERVADAYDLEVDTKVSGLTALLEPLMIVVMGAVVAMIVISVMLPILKMNQIARH